MQFFVLYVSKNPEKGYHGFHKKNNKNNNNMKCFLSNKSAYYNDFWRIMWH